VTELFRLLIIVIVLCVLAWLIDRSPIPVPFRWIAYAVLVIIGLYALLPFLGIHLPA
jgi:hypothetical protein